jgi:hypothetical protein
MAILWKNITTERYNQLFPVSGLSFSPSECDVAVMEGDAAMG